MENCRLKFRKWIVRRIVDWLQFFSSVIGSVAWPSAAVGSVWIFRQKISELMPGLRLKYKDFEASFRLEQAVKEAAAMPALPVAPELQPTEEEKDRFQKLAEISPQAAIVEVRSEIEEALRERARAQNIYTDKVRSMLGITRLLRSHGVIDHQTSALLDDLRAVGNAAAHGVNNTFSVDEAMNYKKLADRVIAELGSAEPRPT